MSDDITAAASYLLSAIRNAADTGLAEDTYRALADVLPYHLRASLDDAYDGLALA